MAKTVETAVKAARAKTLGRAKGDREQAAVKHAGEEAAVAQAAAHEANAAVLPKVAGDVAQAEVGTLSPEATLAGDFSFAGVMADAAASTAAGGAYAGAFSGGSSAFAQDSGSTDSVGSGVSGGGVSIPLVLGVAAAAAGVVAAVSGGGDDDNNSTPTPPPPPPPPPPAANTAPTITSAATVSATEDTAAKFTVTATDKEGGALTYTATGAKSGTVADNGNGTFTYTPNANFNGSDTVTVSVKDSGGLTTTQTVTVNVASVNDAPTFDADTTKSFTAIAGTATAFSIKASDVDGDTLTPTVFDAPDNGTITGNSYTANKGYVGSDSFTIRVSDGKGGTADQVVTVNVTAPPVTVVTIDKAGTDNAAAGNVTYNVTAGAYVHTIDGFGAGDKIVSPAGNAGTLVNSSFTDGQATIQYANSGVVTQIVLTGLTAAQDAQLFGPNDLNTVFGGGTFA